jgi:hypothetical protein
MAAPPSLSNASVQPTTNYLVPSSGNTNCIPLAGVLTAGQPVNLDWSQFNTDSMAFQPQGTFMDNSAGTQELVIAIYTKAGGALIWTERVKAGDVAARPFPAPNGQYHVVTGQGAVALVFVDFPVLPYLYTP